MKRSCLIGWLWACTLLVGVQAASSYTVMFYNVENLFDCEDDPRVNDNEFLPNKGKYWSPKRYTAKRENIARVIAAVGEGKAPVLVGLCEVENEEVVRQLVQYRPLSNLRYRYVHYESPDPRGIDVALLYQPRYFTPLETRPLPVIYTTGKATRDVLYVKGVLASTDTLHIMVCHAPSRRGGEVASALKRQQAMSVVCQQVDSLLAAQSQAKILIMGDFNDTPVDKSIVDVLGAVPLQQLTDSTRLVNMMTDASGSYKYRGEWSQLDQLMVSPALLSGKGFVVENKKGYVYSAEFLLQDDATHMGKKPYRTYQGPRYLGGYSDHLPIYLRLCK